ncbi:hypothetical protein CQ018_13525 [Arthrobacter sp. MYb227]|uniref:GAP family protein n=1 Tax=Arthrobacter sp. MYb227 TaxID=1848601 RepID=UPI000CFDFEC3|nr:GAP family protein [Arthrobacter sp. MYb227]PQZ91649.1 hypothetical protein CQ018_13525 [Arthrobacter sp. MYb227]
MTFGITLGTTGLLLSLGILALIDSTSIGTLVIPIWLVLRARDGAALRSAVFYLMVLAGFYLTIGLLILMGASWLDAFFTGEILEIPALRWALLVLGLCMFIGSFAMNRKPKQAIQQTVTATSPAGSGTTINVPSPTPPAQGRWGSRLDKAMGTKRGVALLGITAGLLELPTMLPYLGAIGLLASSGKPVSIQVSLLVLYALVMIVPALVVIGARAVAGQRLSKLFDKLSDWLAKASGETLAWVVGIMGFLLLRSSLSFLFPYAAWNPFK